MTAHPKFRLQGPRRRRYRWHHRKQRRQLRTRRHRRRHPRQPPGRPHPKPAVTAMGMQQRWRQPPGRQKHPARQPSGRRQRSRTRHCHHRQRQLPGRQPQANSMRPRRWHRRLEPSRCSQCRRHCSCTRHLCGHLRAKHRRRRHSRRRCSQTEAVASSRPASGAVSIEQGAPPLPAMASHMVSVSPSRSASADRRAPGNGLAIYFNVADPSVAPTCCPSGASCVRLHVLDHTCDVGRLAPVAHDRPERCSRCGQWGCPPGAGCWPRRISRRQHVLQCVTDDAATHMHCAT